MLFTTMNIYPAEKLCDIYNVIQHGMLSALELGPETS